MTTDTATVGTEQRKIRMVSAKEIDLSKNIRFTDEDITEEERSEFEAFVASIKASGGNENPVPCDEDASGKLFATDGRRRVMACDKLGIPVKVAVRKGLRSDAEIAIEGAALNAHKQMSWQYYAIVCQRAMKPGLSKSQRKREEQSGNLLTMKDFADKCGVSYVAMTRYMKIAELPQVWITTLGKKRAKREEVEAIAALKTKSEREQAYVHLSEKGTLPAHMKPKGKNADKPKKQKQLHKVLARIEQNGDTTAMKEIGREVAIKLGITKAQQIEPWQIGLILAMRLSFHEGSHADPTKGEAERYTETPDQQYALRVHHIADALESCDVKLSRENYPERPEFESEEEDEDEDHADGDDGDDE